MGEARRACGVHGKDPCRNRCWALPVRPCDQGTSRHKSLHRKSKTKKHLRQSEKWTPGRVDLFDLESHSRVLTKGPAA